MPMLRGWIVDLRQVVRLLVRSRGFTTVAVLSLAIGIGANAAIYSVIRVLLLDPMPVRAPEELSLAYWHHPGDLDISQNNSSGYTDPVSGLSLRSNVSYPIYAAVRDLDLGGTEVSGFNFLRDLSVSSDDRAATLAGGVAGDGRFFDVLAPPMAMGRPLDQADNVEGGPVSVVISHGFWMRAFGGDVAMLGRTIRVNGVPATIVGITAAGFRGLSKGGFFPATDVTVPLAAVPRIMPRWQSDGISPLASTRLFWVRLLVRTPHGVSPEPARAQMATAVRTGVAAFAGEPEATSTVTLVASPRGLDQTRGDVRRLLYTLLGVVGVVLLIACVNLASLSLARGVGRQREMAVRRALGASRFQLMRFLLLEGLCLALAGGAAGLLLTAWSRRVLTTLLTAGLGTEPLSTQPLEVSVDLRLGLWTMGVSLVAALLCSLLPALRLSTPAAGGHLRHQAAGDVAPRLTLGRVLIALQIAVSIPLVVGAILFLQTVANLGRVDVGFDPEGIAFFKLDPAATGAPAADHASIYRQVLTNLEAVPGVGSVSLVENAFMSGITSNTGIEVDGERVSLYMNAVGPGFLDTLGLRLLAGRAPGLQDGPGAPRVAALNETASRRLFGDRSPIGEVIRPGEREIQIVGVVSDARYDRQRGAVQPIMFDSALQRPGYGGHHVVMKTTLPIARLEPAIREAVTAVHRDLPVAGLRTQVAQMNDTIARERVFAMLLSIFGGFALLLSSIGLHGVTSYAVSRRRNEMGVRVALGAAPGQVLWLLLRQVLVLAVAGLAAGVPLAAAVAPVVGSLLYGVTPTDVVVIGVSALLMLGVAALAGFLPARQAARMDPLAALRD